MHTECGDLTLTINSLVAYGNILNWDDKEKDILRIQ